MIRVEVVEQKLKDRLKNINAAQVDLDGMHNEPDTLGRSRHFSIIFEIK